MERAYAEYTTVAKLLHWLIAAFILVQIPLGLYMVSMREANAEALAAGNEPPYSILQIFEFFQLHKSLGITVLGLVSLRLLWRLVQPPPSLPETMPALERTAAHSAHTGLYFLMFALPLTGWALVSVESDTPIPTILYKTVPLPHLPVLGELPPETKKVLDPAVTSAHAILGWILGAIVVIHILAALRHGLILKDGVMSRMLLRFSRKPKGIAPLFALAAYLGVLAFSPDAARAADWSVIEDQSKIGFTASAAGTPYTGAVTSYKADIFFEPESPEMAKVNIVMDTASFTFGRKDYDSAVQGAEWFDIKTYPQAVYKADGAETSGDGKYTLNGILTLKGTSQPLPVPFTIEVEDGEAKVKGEAVLSRKAFKLGPETFGGVAIDDSVKITFDLTASKLTN